MKDTLGEFLASHEDGLFYLGHASILVRLSGKLMLFDPVSNNSKPYQDSWRFFPPQIEDHRAYRTSAVLVSHCHQDHFDRELLFNESSPLSEHPVHIVAGRDSFPKDSPEFIYIPPGQDIQLFKDVWIRGILHPTNGIDSSFLIWNDKLKIYHGNDNWIGPQLLQGLGTVDIACIPFSYVHWYPFLLEEVSDEWKRLTALQEIHKHFKLGIAQAEALQAKRVIPFGGNLIYNDPAETLMTKSVKSPFDFYDFSGKDPRFTPLFAGDYICGGKERYHHVWNAEGYESKKKEFLADQPRDPGRMNGIVFQNIKDEKFVYIGPRHIPGEPIMQLDLKRCSVQFVYEPRYLPFHYFKLDNDIYYEWKRGSVDMEEVIGTRKFTLLRVPNVYDPDLLKWVNTCL